MCAQNHGKNQLYLLHSAIVDDVHKRRKEEGYYAIDKEVNAYQIFKILVKNIRGSGVSRYNEPNLLYVNHDGQEKTFADYFLNLFKTLQEKNTAFSNLSLTGGIREKNNEERNLTFDLEVSSV